MFYFSSGAVLVAHKSKGTGKMADLRNPRTWNDEEIDLALPTTIGWATNVNIDATLAAFAADVNAEANRRAEIRLERGEYGQHDASWYEPRPLPMHPFDESHSRHCPECLAPAMCESGWTGDRCTFPLFHDGPHSNE